MKTLLIAFSVLLTSSCVGSIDTKQTGSAQSERQFGKQKMDNFLAVLGENNKAMLSLEIVEKGKRTYQCQTGFAYFDSTGQKVSADAATQYRVGSITKMFTATIIMQLIEQGKLALDTTLSNFYPEIKNAQEITIDHMLRHRSGLANYTTNDAGFWEYYTSPQSQSQMIRRFSSFDPEFNPGEKYSYSNTNYMLLGYVIEKVTGEPYQTVLKNNIVDPLDLRNTHLGTEIDTSKNQAQSFYYSRSSWHIQEQWHMSTAHAAGAIISSPQDLNVFSTALMSGKLVSKASLEQMLSHSYGYGRGINRFPFYNNFTHGHYGLIGGFYSALLYFPEDGVSFAVNVNGLALNFNDDVVVPILRIYYNRDFELPDYHYQPVEIDETRLNAYVGTFHWKSSRGPDSDIRVPLFIRDGQLFSRIPGIYNEGGKDFEISFIATSERTFFNASEGIELRFEKTWYGTIDSERFVATHSGIEYEFQKID